MIHNATDLRIMLYFDEIGVEKPLEPDERVSLTELEHLPEFAIAVYHHDSMSLAARGRLGRCLLVSRIDSRHHFTIRQQKGTVAVSLAAVDKPPKLMDTMKVRHLELVSKGQLVQWAVVEDGNTVFVAFKGSDANISDVISTWAPFQSSTRCTASTSTRRSLRGARRGRTPIGDPPAGCAQAQRRPVRPLTGRRLRAARRAGAIARQFGSRRCRHDVRQSTRGRAERREPRLEAAERHHLSLYQLVGRGRPNPIPVGVVGGHRQERAVDPRGENGARQSRRALCRGRDAEGDRPPPRDICGA
eukprot:7377045-Prymnesium_polylepis.1